jgi:purine-binding chemotaxis protein CheW
MRAVGSDGNEAVPTDDQEWERIARSGANQQFEESKPERIREFLSFGLAGATYAIPVERVREIIRLREVTPMPRVPACITGVVALRGDIVQVVDMRIRLALEMGAPTRRSRIIVLHGDNDRVTGIAVDSVQEVLRVNEEEIDTVPTLPSGVVSELCKRGDEFVSIVDLDYMLALDET